MASVEDNSNENISWQILVGTIVTIVPATICVVLRLVARRVASAGLWWDDYTIAVSLVSGTLGFGISNLQAQGLTRLGD